ncbi:Mov34/MPN/PAD-1 family protein [Erythrobacter sp. WG]|uniref:Mov34/MPN/PAD-1 family protein n=1 Tax=Erythrobacter sp. WG TaxID=2985510 RepID=UPI002B4BC25C|nr:Mov34/MPN/PAD-1 family protein [Erythrobacter sp. WG]
MGFWAYMLHCRGGVFYAGHTDDLERRIAQHKSGTIPGFTSERLPVELVWAQEFPTRHEAKAAELRIKGWSRAKKLALIREDWDAISRLAKRKGSPSTSSGQAEIEVSAQALAAMRAAAAAAHPHEACGILLGEGSRITEARAARNVHPAPRTHFEIDPQALIDAHRAARGGGPQVIGYFHSHPCGPAAPSATDRACASGDGRVWAILGEPDAVTFWRDGEAGFTALPLCLTDG